MKLSMTVMLFALVLAPAATEAESEKKIELMLDMSTAEVKKLKGKPITRVNLGNTIIRKGLGNTTVPVIRRCKTRIRRRQVGRQDRAVVPQSLVRAP